MNMHAPVNKAPRRGKAAAGSGMRWRAGLVHPDEAKALVGNMDMGDVTAKAFRDKVERFAAIMREDRWDPNGETVVVSVSGKILDGRARLLACIEAGVPFPVILVTGVPDEFAVSIDAHSRRSATDVLAIDEVEHARVVSSAWQAIASYLNAPDRSRWRYQGSSAVTTEEIALLTDVHREDITISADHVMALKLGKVVPNTVSVACHYLASLADPEMANAFFREMAAAGPRGRSAPAALRRRYEDPTSNTTFTYRMAVFSKAWAAYLDKRNPTLAELDYRGPVERRGNLGDEAFPPIRGVDPTLRLDFTALRTGTAGSRAQARTGSRGLSAFEGVTVREVEMTPDLCREFLERNGPKGRNRSIRQGHVRDLARMIGDGNWRPNGKTLKRTAAGDLLDGQHRCRAGIAAGKPFVTLVVEGLDPGTFATLDLGQRKSLGARIRARGDNTGQQVNSITTTFWRLSKNLTGGEPPAVEAELIYLHDKEAIDRSVKVAKADKMKETLDVSIAGALHRVFSIYDQARADHFMYILATGFGLHPGHPIHKLREELKRRHGDLNTHVRKVRAVIRTWNVWVAGKGARDLKLIVPGETGYPEPQPPGEKAPKPERPAAA